MKITHIRRQILSEISADEDEVEVRVMPTAHDFSMSVELFAHENTIPLIEALAHKAAEMDIDIVEVPKLVSRPLKEKIAFEESIPLTSATAALPM